MQGLEPANPKTRDWFLHMTVLPDRTQTGVFKKLNFVVVYWA